MKFYLNPRKKGQLYYIKVDRKEDLFQFPQRTTYTELCREKPRTGIKIEKDSFFFGE